MQQRVELLPDQPVPPGYLTQTIFLICNFDWLRKEREEELLTLYTYFQLFGRAIGQDNAAIWFWREQPKLGKGLADAMDIERESNISGELGLKASESPYLVITSKGDWDHATVGLGELDAVGIKNVLTDLADKLIAREINLKDVHDRAWWEAWHSGLRSVLNSAGRVAKTITVSIDTKFFKVEMDGSRL